MVVWDEISVQESNINQIFNNTMSAMSCTEANFVKKNAYLAARIA